MTTPVMHAEGWSPKGNPWLIAVAVTMAAFMEVLDTTIVNVSLPHIAGTLSAGQDESTWTLTSYLVANGIVLPISGYLSRLLGRKRYFLICIGAFTLSSLACGLADSLSELIVFRLFQGFFGGGLQPNQQSIILDTFAPEARGRAFGVTAIATVVAPVLGPTLGGWITDNFSWRWSFFINVPVGIIALLAVARLVEDPPWVKRQSAERKPIDGVGLGLIALGLGCLQVTLDRGEDEDWLGSPFIRVFAVLSVIGLSGAVAWLLYTKKPIVHLRVLADRNFAAGCITMFIMAAILYSSAILLPQLAQQQLGYTATWAGLLLSPGAVVLIGVIMIASQVMKRVQARYLVGFGFFLLGLSMLYSQNLVPDIDFTTLAMMRGAQTIGLGFLFVPISTLAYVSIKPELNGDAAALNVMFRNIGGSIGISVATAMITERSQTHMAYLSAYLTPLFAPYNELLARLQETTGTSGVAPAATVYRMLLGQSALLAYSDIFQYCAAMAFLTVPLIFIFGSIRVRSVYPSRVAARWRH